MALTYYAANLITGLAADTKPTTVPTGSEFIETDTRKRYYFNGTSWILQQMPNFKSYKVFKISTTYYITDQHGKVENSGTDFQVAIQAVIDAMANNSAIEFNFDAGTFTTNNPISLPSADNANIKQVNFNGKVFAGFRAGSNIQTLISVSTSFPTNRYVIEAVNANGSGTNPLTHINGLAVANTDFTNRNAGFLKLESDDYFFRGITVRNCYSQYMWRGLHLIGSVWWCIFDTIEFGDNNASFTGDADIIMEQTTHASAINPSPKTNLFSNIISQHSGTMANGLQMKSGSYNYFYNYMIEGTKYTNAIICLDNSDSLNISDNEFYDVWILDLATPSPDVRQASIYLNGSGCYDNNFTNSRVVQYPYNVKFAGSTIRNTVELSAYFGNTISIDDAGAGVSNTIIVKSGARTGSTESAVTTTSSICRVIDQRRGASNHGKSTQSGNGVATTFNIAHGCFTTPTYVNVVAGSTAARALFHLTVDGTNITVNFAAAPASASNNLVFYWNAEVYS